MNNQTEDSNFWHMDGALKAQSNRMTVITIVASIIALVAVAGMIAVWLQPPTVIRVLPDGQAKVVGPTGRIKDGLSPSLLSSVEAAEAPTKYEKEAYVRAFLTEYLNYDPHTLPANWSGALNMMTLNLRHAALDQFQAKDNRERQVRLVVYFCGTIGMATSLIEKITSRACLICFGAQGDFLRDGAQTKMLFRQNQESHLITLQSLVDAI